MNTKWYWYWFFLWWIFWTRSLNRLIGNLLSVAFSLKVSDDKYYQACRTIIFCLCEYACFSETYLWWNCDMEFIVWDISLVGPAWHTPYCNIIWLLDQIIWCLRLNKKEAKEAWKGLRDVIGLRGEAVVPGGCGCCGNARDLRYTWTSPE
jgi:hypothetical protein